MKAMIFAAGLGTRLRPLTDNMPKALVPVDGKPLLWHVLSRLEAQGVRDFVVNVHHFAPMVKEYLSQERFPECRVAVSDESSSLLDTGGGIRAARGLLGGDEAFLVHNVDIISNFNLGEMSLCGGDMAALLVSERQTSRHLLFDSQTMLLKGWVNEKSGELKTPFRGAELSSCVKLAFSGIHMLSPMVFGVMDAIDAAPEDFPLYDGAGCTISRGPLGEAFPIMDFYLRACLRHPVRATLQPGLKLIDVGKPQALSDPLLFELLNG